LPLDRLNGIKASQFTAPTKLAATAKSASSRAAFNESLLSALSIYGFPRGIDAVYGSLPGK